MNEDAKDGLYKKQTAVNYYRENILKITRLLVTGEITTDAWVLLETELIKQAKELENQQKQNYLKEYFEWHNSMWFASHTPEDIIEFNETYGGDKQECQFEPDSNLTSATKCKWCGLEKWQHKTYEGEQ